MNNHCTDRFSMVSWAICKDFMSQNQKRLEDTLVKGLSDILKRTLELNPRDQLAIAQEYKEWIHCISNSDFPMQEILVIDKYTFS